MIISFSTLLPRWAKSSSIASGERRGPGCAATLASHKVPKKFVCLQFYGNWSNQESKFDFLATHQCLEKIDEGQQKIKIVRTNRQSNLRASCQSISF